MKTHAACLAIFMFFTTILSNLVGADIATASNSGFLSDPLGMAGMSTKSNGTYRDLVEQVFEEFRKTSAPFIVLNHGEEPAAGFQADFANYCMDDDSADVVSWLTSGDSSRKISFSCVFGGEFPRIHERLFVFSIRDGRLIDVQVASANVPAGTTVNQVGRKLPVAKSWGADTESDKVLVAVSGAMISGGVTASKVGGVFQPRELASREAVSGAMVSGLGAAVSHFVFNMSPARSGLAGGGLTLALEDINDGIPDPLTGVPRRRADRKGDDNGGFGPISLRFTFKF